MRLVWGPTVSGRTAPSSFGVKASGPQVCPCAYRDSPPAPGSRQAEQKETLVLGEQQWEVGTSGGGDGSLPLRLHPYPTQPSTPLTEPLGRLPNTPLRLALASGIIPVSPHTASVNLPQCLCLPCAPHWISRFPFPLPAPQSSMPPPPPSLLLTPPSPRIVLPCPPSLPAHFVCLAIYRGLPRIRNIFVHPAFRPYASRLGTLAVFPVSVPLEVSSGATCT